MPLPKAPLQRGTILDKSAYGKKTADVTAPAARAQDVTPAAAAVTAAAAPASSAPAAKKTCVGKKTKTAALMRAPIVDTAPESGKSEAPVKWEGKSEVQPAIKATPKAPSKTKTKAAAKPDVKTPAVKGKGKAKAQPQSRAVQAADDQTPIEALSRAEELAAGGAARLRSPRSSSAGNLPRLFVLDTNVLLHDPTCLFRFQEHDVYLPMVTLEEIDNHKTGTSDISRNARQVSRTIDRLVEASTGPIREGVALSCIGNKEARGRLYFQPFDFNPTDLPAGLPHDKADNMILAVVKALPERFADKHVVLVSKDINIRIKATAMGLTAEDYFNDKTIDDTDMLFTGRVTVSPDFWEKKTDNLKSWQGDGAVWYSFEGPMAQSLTVNQFVTASDGSFVGQVKSVSGGTATLSTVRDYMQPRNAVWGVHARNLEQSLALNLLMNPDIDFVTLLGQAGTGKTLITLAAALSQTLEERRFSEIIFTRATVSVGEEIGFLPGTEEEKMTPWMGALEDNLEVLNKSGDRGAGGWSRSAAGDIIRSRIRIKSMSFMRGRTFLNKFVIIDEAQNLSPKQMKTLITRAGPGTKIVCMGNIAQIDTPYLTEGSSGLTYVVERFRGWAHAGHITLQRGERSRLADYATEVL